MWIGSYTATLGPWQIGVRVDDVDVRDILVAELGDALQPSAAPPTGYAVVTTVAGANGVGRELPSLRFGCVSVLRSRQPLRLAQALVHHLHSHPEPRAGTLRLRTAAVVHAGRVVLLPASALWAAGTERQLEQLGLCPIDSPIVDVDSSGRVRLSCWSWGGTDRTEPMEVSAWLIEEHLLGGLDPHSRSSVLAAGTNLIDPASSLDAQTALNAIARMLPIIETIGADWSIADITASAVAQTPTA